MYEKLFSVATAVERVTGQRLDPSSLQRWRKKGVSGVTLNTVRVGGRRMCSKADVRQFLEKVTAQADGEQASGVAHTNRQRQAAINQAEVDLDKFGI